MGIGKTTIEIARQHVQHLINLMREHIKQHPNLHYSTGQVEESSECPSNKHMLSWTGLDCPCFEKSPTYPVQSSLGIGLVVVPKGLLSNWWTDWRKAYYGGDCISDPTFNSAMQGKWGEAYKTEAGKVLNAFRMKFVMGHGDAKPSEGNNWTGELVKLASAPVVPGDLAKLADKQPQCVPKLENSSVLVLTTSASCVEHVLKKFVKKGSYEFTPPPTKARNGTVRQSAPRTAYKEYWELKVACFTRDECHKERLDSSTTLQLLLNNPFFRRQKQMHINPMSGTLITSGPIDIAYYLEAMKRDSWAQHPILKGWVKGEAIKEGRDWDAALGRRNLTPELAAKTVKKLLPLIEVLVLRFSPRTNFLSTGAIVTLPPNKYQEISCQIEPYWNEMLLKQKEVEDQQFREQEKKRKANWLQSRRKLKDYVGLKMESTTLHYRSRLYASFPYLWKMNQDLTKAGQDMLKLTQDEWQRQTKEKAWTSKNEPYLVNIQKIADSSGKLVAVKEIIKQFEDVRDKDNNLAKLVFCSNFLVGARVVYHVSSCLNENGFLY